MATTLTPAQRGALDGLLEALPVGNVFVLRGDTGMGKSTLLREVQHLQNAAFLTMKDFVDAMRPRDPLALEETFEDLVLGALRANACVIVDDLHVLTEVTSGCAFYPRRGFLTAPLLTLTTWATEAGKKLLFATIESPPDPVRQRAYSFVIPEFKPADYACLCQTYLGTERAGRLDFEKIYRFAPRLNAHQLKAACVWLRRDHALDTARFVEYLRLQRMTSNVDLGEVQAVDLRDLRGVDAVLESLEANVILPLENDELAVELNLKPRRGVLLAGPPGTGKTTVGRALAHRLKSKFFLIDGTFVSGTRDFYERIHHVFETAKENAPSIIFVDDSDVIFESGEELGLYRYLLTMLDGLESESAGRVSVVLTAMDVSNLPPALIRSGRIELWLEMALPDDEARAAILRQHLAALPPGVGSVEVLRVVDQTRGFTGADLKRLVEDGKILFAYDRARGLATRPPTDYFLDAAAKVRANKDRYNEAAAKARVQRPSRPPYFALLGDGCP
jgi:ATP-dependent 26S proteasome regulatory subunit